MADPKREPDTQAGEPVTAAITVMVASDPKGPLAAWLPQLAREPGFALEVPTADPAGIDSALERRKPQVLVVERALMDALHVQSLCLRRNPLAPVRVLLVLEAPGGDPTVEVLTNQLHGFVIPDGPFEMFVKAVRAVARGELWLPRASLGKALRELQQGPHMSEARATDEAASGSPTPGALTLQETRLVALLLRGLTNKQIARHLDIVEDTVKKHLRNIYTKLGLHRRTLVLAQMGDTRASDEKAPGTRTRRSLTARETQIASLIRRGCTNKQIARHLGIMEDTVKKHLQRIFTKLRVHRRTSVILGRLSTTRNTPGEVKSGRGPVA